MDLNGGSQGTLQSKHFWNTIDNYLQNIDLTYVFYFSNTFDSETIWIATIFF